MFKKLTIALCLFICVCFLAACGDYAASGGTYDTSDNISVSFDETVHNAPDGFFNNALNTVILTDKVTGYRYLVVIARSSNGLSVTRLDEKTVPEIEQ